MCVCMCVCEGVKNVRKMYEKRGGLLETYENVEGGGRYKNCQTWAYVLFEWLQDGILCIAYYRIHFTPKNKTHTAWKLSIFGVFLVHIFPYSDWIARYIPYLSVFSPNAPKCGQEKLRIRALFTQWQSRQ